MASRVYELAEELKLSSREVIAALANLGVVARSHSSNVDDPAADKLRKAQQEGSLAQLTKAAAARPARPARPSRPSRTAAAPAAATEKAPAAQTAKPDPKSSAARQAAASTAAPAPSRPPASNKATDVASIDEVISGPKPNQSQRLPKPGESGVREVKRPPRTARPAAPRPSAERTARPAAARPSAERSRPGRGRPAAFVDQNQPPPPPRKKRAPDKAIVDELTVPRGITVSELSSKLGIPANEIIKKLFLLGQVYTMSQSLDDDAAELIASEFGCELTIVSPEDDLEADEVIEDDPADLKPRPPVITVMGHVDHGKTLLLDAIREADVVSTEHGGITQHIGAYQIHKNDRAITFIDTPGHEAFTQMRARGAQVTDIAVLVVAADDGVKPQTVEALNHAKAADVPIVVAVNKIDKPEADPQRPRQQLTEHELVPEEWGGETPFVDVSAKQGTNIDDLLDVLLLVADIKELKANPDAPARGSVIEAHLDKGRGPVATVLVNRGTLKIGDSIVCGGAWAKVRAMFDDTGSKMTQAGPGSPAQVLGFDTVPMAGDDFRVVADERKAKQIAANRAQKLRAAELVARKRVSLTDVFSQAQEGEEILLNVVLKADVQGSLEAVADALEKLKVENAGVRVLHRQVGAVTEGDVTLAEASNAVILGFNVRPDSKARVAAEEAGVEIRTYQIIYKLVEEIEAALKGMLEPEYEEVVLGRAEVREVFKIPKGVIAGSFVLEGTITRNAKARLLRDGVIVHDSTIGSLRRFKDDAREVQQGYECGIGIEGYTDIKVGDHIEVYEMKLVPRL